MFPKFFYWIPNGNGYSENQTQKVKSNNGIKDGPNVCVHWPMNLSPDGTDRKSLKHETKRRFFYKRDITNQNVLFIGSGKGSLGTFDI